MLSITSKPAERNIMPIEWSAISALTAVLRLIKDSIPKKEQPKESPEEPQPNTMESEEHNESYRERLGHRHKYLRTEILKLNPREMADFYEFEKVAELEGYESGNDEFPRSSMKRLEEFFFVRREYIEEERLPIFDSFPLCYTREGCRALLSQGFEPYILTAPSPRDSLFCYVLFHKSENNLERMIISNVVSSFSSSGGGRMNIENLIGAMEELGLDSCHVSILQERSQNWSLLESGNYYNKGMIGFGGAADHECEDIYWQWVSEFRNKMK